jgi:hypothetical protein
MYLINKEKNSIEPIEEITFKSAGFRERSHLQEWIAKNPESLGEELLIIQKEFQGFDDTNERLDLLALDKKRNLVVIENKLDDTGRDVVWQSLKYASYCSGLNTQGVKDIFDEYLKNIDPNTTLTAQKALEEFFDNEDFEGKLNIGNSQRIIMVAGEFRKEVTSTALWLLNYGLKIQCFKVTPYKLDEELLLDFDQIIPVKEAEDYVIRVATKNREEIASQEELSARHHVRLNFWSEFLQEVNKKNNYCSNLRPSKDSWIGVALGVSGVSLNLVVSREYARSEIYINRGDKAENKRVFDYFLQHKEQIEKDFGASLVWERMDDKVTSRIKWQLNGVNVFDEKDYPKMINFLINGLERMKKAFSLPIKDL